MSKPTPRHAEHVQREKPKAETAAGKADVPAGPGPGRAEAAPGEPDLPPPPDPAMAWKYWVAILIWVAGFVLLIFYEAIAAIWRG
jgi:hypothetical protein